MTINRFCSSGLQAIALAAGSVKAGFDDVVIAGGMESMTMVPMTGNKPSASPEVMEKYPDDLHADGHHGGERRQPLQHQPRRSKTSSRRGATSERLPRSRRAPSSTRSCRCTG